ncbi:MAG: glycosyltransferase 2 family protein [Verrucomicrobiota bacterium]
MKKLWQIGWRVALCAVLLLWIFHCIFVNEARIAHGEAWPKLSRLDQWRRGWIEGPPALWQTLTSIQPGWFLLSLVLMGSTILLGVFRWRMVLRVQGIHLPFWRTAEISLVAHFFNSFLLGSTGGDLMKAYYAARETHHRKTEAVTTVFVDRLIGLWAMLLFAGVMMIPIPNARLIFGRDRVTMLPALLILAMLIACSVVMILAFRGGLSKHWPGARAQLRRLPKGEHLERSLDACRRFGQAPHFLLRTFAVSMLLNVMCVVQWQVVGRGLGLSIPPLAMFVVVPMVICIAALPLTPSGLGVRDILFVQMLDDPVLATSGLSLSLLAYAGSLFWSLVGGGVYLLLKEKHHLAERDLS